MICVGVYAAAGGAFPGGKKVNEDVPLHDGDVLVDSLNISESDPSDSGSSDSDGKKDESSLVTSDDVSELKNTDTYFQELRATLDIGPQQDNIHADGIRVFCIIQNGKGKSHFGKNKAAGIYGTGKDP